MRSALRQRESDLQYREVAEHFARLDIHPGYLAELAREPNSPNHSIAANNYSRVPAFTHPIPAMDYISFGVAMVGLIVSISTAITYYGRTNQISQQPVTAQSPIPDPNIVRLNDSVRRLGLALSIVVADMQAHSSPSDTAQGKVVEVIVPKANLRIAPDNRSSAVMAIARGSRLLVDLEQSEWLKVFAPSGESLWIQKALTSEKSN